MILQHVCLEWFHTPEDDSTDVTRVLPLGPDMCLVPMADQQLFGYAPVAADVADVLGLPYVHHVHVVLEITLVREPLIASQTLDLAVPVGRDVVHFEQVFVVEEDVDRLLTVFAVPFDVALSIVKLHLVQQFMREITVRLRASRCVLRVRGEVKGDALWGAVDPVACLSVLLDGHVRAGLPAFVAHLLQRVLDPVVVSQVEIVGTLLPEKSKAKTPLAKIGWFRFDRLVDTRPSSSFWGGSFAHSLLRLLFYNFCKIYYYIYFNFYIIQSQHCFTLV